MYSLLRYSFMFLQLPVTPIINTFSIKKSRIFSFALLRMNTWHKPLPVDIHSFQPLFFMFTIENHKEQLFIYTIIHNSLSRYFFSSISLYVHYSEHILSGIVHPGTDYRPLQTRFKIVIDSLDSCRNPSSNVFVENVNTDKINYGVFQGL